MEIKIGDISEQHRLVIPDYVLQSLAIKNPVNQFHLIPLLIGDSIQTKESDIEVIELYPKILSKKEFILAEHKSIMDEFYNLINDGN